MADRPLAGRVVLVFLAALAYFIAFHRWGLFMQDEGVTAYQALRVANGQVPYADFQTAYTPAAYYLHALLFRLFGPSLDVMRASGAVACAATAAVLSVAASAVLPGRWALLPSLLYVLLEDQESRGLVTHAIPYPARYIQTLWALSLCLTLAYARRPRCGLALALGLVTAAIAAFKHTAGIYNAWAVGLCLILLARDRPGGTAPAALGVLPPAFLLAVLAALPVLLGGLGVTVGATLAVLYLPLAAAAVLLLPGALPWARDPAAHTRRRRALATTGGDLFAFGAGALLPTAGWVAWLVSRVGARVLTQRLIVEGPAAGVAYAISPPAPGALTAGAALLVAAVLAGRSGVARRIVSRAAAIRAVGGVGALLGGLALAWLAGVLGPALQMDEPLVAVMHVGREIDNAAFYAVFAVSYAFLPRLRAALAGRARIDAPLLAWLHGISALLLAYPRFDMAHLYDATLVLLVPAVVLLERTLAFFRTPGAARVRWLPLGAGCALAVVAATRLWPRLDAQLAWRGGPVLAARTPLAAARGGLYGTRYTAPTFTAVNRVVAAIAARTAPGTPLFAYPALPALYFLSERENPAPLDYFFRGFGQGPDELATVVALERARVPVVVTMVDHMFVPVGSNYFPVLNDYLRRHFVQTAFFPPFHLLERVAAPAGAATALFPVGLRDGDFDGGQLRGFRSDSIRGGLASVVQQGTDFSGLPGSAEIPFPGGPGSHAVNLRSAGDGRAGSIAILTSLPFVPGTDALSFATLSESPRVRPEILFLVPAADILQPAAADVQGRVPLPIEHPGTGPTARFTTVRVPFPGGRSRPVKVQFRQQTLDTDAGYFTLVTALRAGDPAAADADRDRDGVADDVDNCPHAWNPDQTTSDGDRPGDPCDNCPYVQNNDQADRDGDGTGDRCTTDLDGDGYTDEADLERFAAAFGGASDSRADLDGDGRTDLLDLALVARQIRIGFAADDIGSFTSGFFEHSVNGGLALTVPRGTVISGIPGSDLIRYPWPEALLVRSDEAGRPSAEGVLTSSPFVPSGPRLTLRVLSESPDVAATVRVLRATRTPARPHPEDVLVEAPLVNERPGTGPRAEFTEQAIDLAPWFDAERPLRSARLQVQFRQHTTRPDMGYFTLVGDVRTGP